MDSGLQTNQKIVWFAPPAIGVLFIIMLFILPSAPEKTWNELTIVFVMLLVLDGLLVYSMFYKKIMAMPTKEEFLKGSTILAVMTELPMLFGFIHYFLTHNVMTAASFFAVGFASWFVVYSKLNERLQEF